MNRSLRQYLQSTYLLSLLAIIITMLATTVLWLTRATPSTAANPEKSWPVHAITASAQTNHVVLHLIGIIESPNISQLAAATAAEITQVEVREGDQVQQDQVLIRLVDTTEQLALKKAQASLTSMLAKKANEEKRFTADQQSLKHEKDLLTLQQSALERQSQLAQRNVASKAQYDEAKKLLSEQRLRITEREYSINSYQHRIAQLNADIEQARSDVALAEDAVSDTVIKAPFSGRLTAVNVASGERVQPNTTLVEIFDSHRPEIRAQLPMLHLATLQQALVHNQTVTATATIQQATLRLKLVRLSAQIANGNAGPDAFFAITGPTNHLVRGHALNLAVRLPARSHTFALPQQALYSYDHIYRIINHRLAHTPVTLLGPQAGTSNTIIVESKQLHTGNVVLTSHLSNARNGLAVNIIDAEQ